MRDYCPTCNFSPKSEYESAHYYINAAAWMLQRAARYIAEGGDGSYQKHLARHYISQARGIRLHGWGPRQLGIRARIWNRNYAEVVRL